MENFLLYNRINYKQQNHEHFDKPTFVSKLSGLNKRTFGHLMWSIKTAYIKRFIYNNIKLTNSESYRHPYVPTIRLFNRVTYEPNLEIGIYETNLMLDAFQTRDKNDYVFSWGLASHETYKNKHYGWNYRYKYTKNDNCFYNAFIFKLVNNNWYCCVRLYGKDVYYINSKMALDVTKFYKLRLEINPTNINFYINGILFADIIRELNLENKMFIGYQLDRNYENEKMSIEPISLLIDYFYFNKKKLNI